MISILVVSSPSSDSENEILQTLMQLIQQNDIPIGIGFVNADAELQVLQEYNVTQTPSFVFFKNEVVVDVLQRMQTLQSLQAVIDKYK
jgi:thioredoxin-like negative regulator of GroEL